MFSLLANRGDRPHDVALAFHLRRRLTNAPTATSLPGGAGGGVHEKQSRRPHQVQSSPHARRLRATGHSFLGGPFIRLNVPLHARMHTQHARLGRWWLFVDGEVHALRARCCLLLMFSLFFSFFVAATACVVSLRPPRCRCFRWPCWTMRSASGRSFSPSTFPARGRPRERLGDRPPRSPTPVTACECGSVDCGLTKGGVRGGESRGL